MQDKTTLLEITSAGTGLKINRKKTELMKMNTTANAPVTFGGEPIREMESFVYLGSVVDQQEDTDRDVTLIIFKARAAFVMLKNIWTSEGISVRTKLLTNSSSSTPMWSQSCSTDVRHGGQHRRCNKRSRHSSTPILDAFTKPNGKGRCEMKICGRERDWNCCRDCLYRIDWLDRSRLFQKAIDNCIGFSTHLTTCVVSVDLESNRRFLI